jgi:hypothetical protein
MGVGLDFEGMVGLTGKCEGALYDTGAGVPPREDGLELLESGGDILHDHTLASCIQLRIDSPCRSQCGLIRYLRGELDSSNPELHHDGVKGPGKTLGKPPTRSYGVQEIGKRYQEIQ